MQLWRQFFLLERLTIFRCQVETFHKLAIFRYCNTAHGIPLIQTHRFHQICICEKFNLKNSIIIFNVVCDPDAVPLKWKCWIRLFIRCAQFIQIQIQVEHCEYFMVYFFLGWYSKIYALFAFRWNFKLDIWFYFLSANAIHSRVCVYCLRWRRQHKHICNWNIFGLPIHSTFYSDCKL